MEAYSNHTISVYSFSELRAVADISGRENYEFEREGSVAIQRLKSDGKLSNVHYKYRKWKQAHVEMESPKSNQTS